MILVAIIQTAQRTDAGRGLPTPARRFMPAFAPGTRMNVPVGVRDPDWREGWHEALAALDRGEAAA